MSALSDLLNRHIAASKVFRDMSNRRIAEQAGVSRGTIDNYRSGTHPDAPKEDVLQAFHELLGIPLAELREAAGVPRGEPEPYTAPTEFNRLSHAQRTALDEFVRSFVGPQGAQHVDQPRTPTDSFSQSDTQTEVDEGREAQRYVVLRYNPSEPEVISQGPSIEARDDGDARRQLHSSLELAGVTIDKRSDATVTIAQNGDVITLLGIVREDGDHDREERLIARLRGRGAELAHNGQPEQSSETHAEPSKTKEVDRLAVVYLKGPNRDKIRVVNRQQFERELPYGPLYDILLAVGPDTDDASLVALAETVLRAKKKGEQAMHDLAAKDRPGKPGVDYTEPELP